MKFYDLKEKKHVEVDEGNVVKTRAERKTKNGTQTRYQLIASHDGRKLYKFVGEADFKAAKCKEV